MTDKDLRRWQEHNRQVMKLGGKLSTHYMLDGTIEEHREVCGQCVRNDPELKNELRLVP